jgi:RimJ/RimL family protein N-acetyltransferase
MSYVSLKFRLFSSKLVDFAMGFGFEGEKVRLVPIDVDKHYENCFRWLNDVEITRWLKLDPPMTKLAERDWFEMMSKHQSPPRDVVMAIETLAGQHIGQSGLHQIDFRHGTAVTGTFIGEVDQWGQGYGRDAVQVRSRYAFETLGLRLLLSSTMMGNDRSLRMQQAAGYRISGIVPKRLWKDGEYRDLILTHCSREDWLESLK